MQIYCDPNITTKYDIAANRWNDMWLFRVPMGMSILLQSGDTFVIYLEDKKGKQPKNCFVKLQLQYADEELSIIDPIPYVLLKQSNLALDKPIEVSRGNYITISVLVYSFFSDKIINPRRSFFQLRTTRLIELDGKNKPEKTTIGQFPVAPM